MNLTVVILYEDRIIDPQIPSNCSTFFQPAIDEFKRTRYYEQLWALSECFDLVRDYENKMGIRYELFIRAKLNTLLLKTPSTLILENKSTIIMPDNDHSDGYKRHFCHRIITHYGKIHETMASFKRLLCTQLAWRYIPLKTHWPDLIFLFDSKTVYR